MGAQCGIEHRSGEVNQEHRRYYDNRNQHSDRLHYGYVLERDGVSQQLANSRKCERRLNENRRSEKRSQYEA